MKIHILCENTALSPEFKAEHGLSLYIESAGQKILFDFGQSDIFAENAEKLGLDLREIDFAFLSHGHYDHGGGIKSFMEINHHAPIYISPAAFGPYYNAQDKYIGLEQSLKGNPRFRILNEAIELNNAELYPAFNELNFPLDSAGLQEKSDTGFIPDSFSHEQYLLLNEDGRRILISGCSHRGILNIAEHFKPDVLIGGFHFMKQEIKDGKNPILDKAAEILNSLPCTYYTCHCTGLSQYEYLKNLMGNRLNYLSSGKSLVI